MNKAADGACAVAAVLCDRTGRGENYHICDKRPTRCADVFAPCYAVNVYTFSASLSSQV